MTYIYPIYSKERAICQGFGFIINMIRLGVWWMSINEFRGLVNFFARSEDGS